MKLEKFMIDVTKALLRENKVVFWDNGDSVVISYNGCFAMVIPKTKNVFNHAVSSKPCPIPAEWDAHKLRDTKQLIKMDKITSFVFEAENGDRVYIDEKYTKYFDKHAEFYGISKKSAVYVSENGVLCGIIMPIRKET